MITADPVTMIGNPVAARTHITEELILEKLAEGLSIDGLTAGC